MGVWECGSTDAEALAWSRGTQRQEWHRHLTLLVLPPKTWSHLHTGERQEARERPRPLCKEEVNPKG